MSKPDRIKISHEFFVNGSKVWLGAEIPVAPEEDVVEEFKKGRDTLLESFKAMNPELPVYAITDFNSGQYGAKADPIADLEINAQLEATKKKMMAAKTKEEAEEIFNKAGFPFNLELKQILNDKKTGNGKK